MTDKFHNPNSVPTNSTVQPSDSDKSPGFFVITEFKQECPTVMFDIFWM